jgi:hypothetical protein
MSRGTFDVLKGEAVRLWVAVVALIAVFVALAVGVLASTTQVVGWRVTACGFDSQGAYAKVLVNNLLGGDNYRKVDVYSYLAGQPDAYQATTLRVHEPAHGHGTGVAHERFPPYGTVEGRTVYVLGRQHDQARFVTKKVALKHRGVSIEEVPDDPSLLRCTVTTED